MNVNESEAMRRLPRTCRAADWVLWFDEVDSTNTVARRLLSEAWQPVDAAGPDVAGTATVTACAAAAGVFGDGIADAVAEPPIAVIVADSQTAGHGRLGRQWVSRPGESSMVSFATVLPQSLVIDSRVNGWLQMIAGLAAVEAIDDDCAQVGATCTHASPDIRARRRIAGCSQDGSTSPACRAPPADRAYAMLKWPNDVFLHGRKLGGILLESVMLPAGGHSDGGPGHRYRAQSESSRRPSAHRTRLHRCNCIVRRCPTRSSCVTALPAGDRDRVAVIACGPSRSIRRDYAVALRDETEALCWTLGRRVEARMTDGSVTRGIATALNPDASLTVCADDGVDHVVRTGDVGVL